MLVSPEVLAKYKCKPLNKNGKFSMQAAKTDVQKIIETDNELKCVKRGERLVLLVCIAGLIALIGLMIFGKEARAETYIVPADEYIVAPTGTTGIMNPYGYDYIYGLKRVAQIIPTSTVERAVCAIDAQVTNEATAYTPGHVITMSIYRDSLYAPTAIVGSSYPTNDAHDLPLQTEVLNPTSTWIFDPCYTLQANKVYYMVSDASPNFNFPPSQAVYMRMYHNSTTPAYIEAWNGSAWQWYTWQQYGYPSEEGWKAVIYGYNNLSGYDVPVSSDYGFSTGSALGTDLGTSGNFLADVFKYLFIPPQSSLDSFNGTFIDLTTNRAPLGYLAKSQEAFLSLQPATSSDDMPPLTIDVPTTTNFLLTVKTSLGSIQMWDTSTTQHSTLIRGVFPYLFGWERFGMWMGFCVYLFIRARDMIMT